MAQKRLQHNLLPKFITKHDYSFKVDESIFKPEDLQMIYNGMRQLTNDCYKKAMDSYVALSAREFNVVKNDIDEIIDKNRPRVSQNLSVTEDSRNDINIDEDEKASYAAFNHYHKLHIKRLDLEAEQSCHFLEVQRAEGENDNLQTIIAPVQNCPPMDI